MGQRKPYKKRKIALYLKTNEEIDFDYFLNKISDFYCEQIKCLVGATKKEILSSSRMMHITTGRHALCYAMRTYHGNVITYQSIAKLLGKHHTSIVHSVQIVNPYLPYWRFVNKIKRMPDDDLLAILQTENETT